MISGEPATWQPASPNVAALIFPDLLRSCLPPQPPYWWNKRRARRHLYTSLQCRRRSHGHSVLCVPPPYAPCATNLCSDGAYPCSNGTYISTTGYYTNEERAGTVDHVASAYIPTCREEPQWGLGWRHLSSVFGSVEFLPVSKVSVTFSGSSPSKIWRLPLHGRLVRCSVTTILGRSQSSLLPATRTCTPSMTT
jgi:hypothetical protein